MSASSRPGLQSCGDNGLNQRIRQSSHSAATTTSPMAFAAVPSVEKIREAIVAKMSDRACEPQTQKSSKPRVSRSAAPNLDCAVGANEELSFGDTVQPAAHVFDLGTEACESRGLQIDIAELNCTLSGGPNKPAVLPLDTPITDGASSVVPDDELGTHRGSFPGGAQSI